MKVCFETFGCRLNKAEALQQEAEYIAAGWQVTETHRDADVIVVRGCSVTARAQRDCEKMIAHLKKHYPTARIQVVGCIKKDPLDVSVGLPDFTKVANVADALPTRTARAYLKVQDGCSGRCTFCIVPKFRGTSVSHDFTMTVDRAKRFIDAGYHEIVLTGCNLALYASQGKRLPELVDALASLGGARLRLGSLEPGDVALKTVEAMAAHENVCRFLHIPVQSASNRILIAMRRPYDLKKIDALIDLATAKMPGLGLGCDLIAGFPGEGDLDLSATQGFLKRHPFNNAHIFPYSERPDTIATSFPGKLPHDIKHARAHVLAHIIKKKRLDYAKTFSGKYVEIVVEKSEKGQCAGWTSEYLPCKAIGKVERKQLCRVFVTRVENDTLHGRIEG